MYIIYVYVNYIIYVYIDIYVEILFSLLRYRSLFVARFKKAKGTIRTAVKKMVNFIYFFIFSLLTFHVLRMFCRIRDFFLLLADLIMRTFSIYVSFPLILIGGIKEFALCIYPYGWVLIFSDRLLIYLFWWEIETIFHRHPLEKTSSSKLFYFAVLDGFVEAIFNRYTLEMGYLSPRGAF